MHGLVSYGIATRHVMRQYCNNDASKVKAIKVTSLDFDIHDCTLGMQYLFFSTHT